jgi:O-antigen ligase
MLMKFTWTMSDGTLVSRTHNLFLAAWIYGGLVGLSLFVAFLARAFWVSAQYYMRKNDCTYIALMIFSITCVSTGNHNAISNPHPLYVLLDAARLHYGL